MLKTKSAKPIPYTAVNVIPVIIKIAPAVKIMYPLCSIYNMYITNVKANKFYKLHVLAYDERNMHKLGYNMFLKIEVNLTIPLLTHLLKEK